MARAGTLALLLPALALCALAAACDDTSLDVQWTSTVDTVTLYSIARPDLTRESAYNFSQRATVRLEAPGAASQFDVALDTRAGQLVLLPPGALGIQSRARIAALPGEAFGDVTEAPADTLVYSAAQPVPATTSTTYVVRTDLRTTPFGGQCTYFAKMAPIALDPAEGSLRFIYDVSPVCNDRRLVPPDSLK